MTMLKTKKEKDWFRLKKYPHIGLPFELSDRAWLEKYVSNVSNVSKHAFFPFIHRKTETRKFRKEICHDGTRSVLRKPQCKERELYYSNHIDAGIYSYYSELLGIEYEKRLEELEISDCVTAYRKLKLNPENKNSRNKCNVDFANEIFTYIKSSTEKELVAITFDIKSFFDNLNHQKLKQYWKFVIGANQSLPKHHYNVFRNITKFSYIEENELFNNYKNQITVERHPNVNKKIPIKKKFYLRNKRAIAYCEIDEIDNIRKKGLIKSNKHIYDHCNKKLLGLRYKGIPQGSPISSTLANIYLIDFDKTAHDFLNMIGGLYRRYSDDMVAVCKAEHEEIITAFFNTTIQKYDLEIQASKTQVFKFIFEGSANRFYCFEKNGKTKKLQTNTNFEYLGFQFDGKYTLLKNSSISSYYRKMKRTIARGKFFTYHNNTSNKGQFFKSRLYKRFTFLGAERRRIYERDKKHKDRFILSHKYDWGNYLSYARLASNIIPDNKILGQLRKHWNKFHKLIKTI